MFNANALRQVLAQWPTDKVALTLPAADPILERIRQVLAEWELPACQGLVADLLALLRQWLLNSAAQGGSSWLRVQQSSNWPSPDQWRTAGYDIVDLGIHLDVQARPPRLSAFPNQTDLFDDVFAGVQARLVTVARMEPKLQQLLGLTDFTGVGQREAIRALMHAPSNMTLIANLPTGSGKSLLAQLPALLNTQGRLTLVIVPTVALLMDQEVRMEALLRRLDPHWESRPLAFHSGLSLEQRATVFRNVREGRQPILLTSPESATGSLRASLLESAAAGRITQVVIDEAHLVATWGNGFRPAFQMLPALITALRAASEAQGFAIRIALASATLPPRVVRFLQHAFGPPERTQIISGLYLRPEPRYATRFCNSSDEKRERVLEAIHAAPRPFILYVTRPEEAQEWLDLLRISGLRRVEQFTGETPANRRKELLQRWAENRLDGMVATSAFGLGVDKSDVRTIVHATLPESLDRFYQEVGRSGRDGRASASLLIYNDADIEQAESMSAPRVIGNELGYERWLSLLDRPVHHDFETGVLWLDLNRVRPGLRTRGRGNRTWNLRLLNLMAAARMIEVLAMTNKRPPSALLVPNETDELLEADVVFAAVRLLEFDHRIQRVFDARLGLARAEMTAAAREGFTLMRQVASGETAVEESLANLYRLSLPDVWSPVESFCGGCGAHWQGHRAREVTPQPHVNRSVTFSDVDHDVNLPHRVQPNLLFIASGRVKAWLARDHVLRDALLLRLQPHTLLIPGTLPSAQLTILGDALRRADLSTFIDTFDPESGDGLDGGSGEVRLLLWWEATIPTGIVTRLRSSICRLTAAVLPFGILDPERPDRTWFSVLPHLDDESMSRVLMQ